MAKRGRGSLGLKNFFGKVIRLVVRKKMSDTTLDRGTGNRLNAFIVKQMNKAGKKAAKRVKRPDWTPKFTGALIQSIVWQKATLSASGKIVQGGLFAGGPTSIRLVDYAALQESGHPTKSKFLDRGIKQVAQPEFDRLIRKKDIEDVVVGGIGFNE